MCDDEIVGHSNPEVSPIDNIIICMDVVAHYNPNMRSLYDSLVTEKAGMDATTPEILDAFETGLPVYETLVKVQINLANALHDYIYAVIHPLSSNITKNIIREQICREVFGIEAHF